MHDYQTNFIISAYYANIKAITEMLFYINVPTATLDNKNPKNECQTLID